MKKIFTLLIVLIAFNLSAQDTKKVLFVGNSYTYGNNLPVLVENIANANGDVLIHDQNTPGGYTFNSHSTNATTLNKIASNDWDYVILQAQSQEPSFPPAQVAADTKPYAVILNDSIKANNECTITLFFMTWGRENGDAANCGFYPPLCTYTGMQQRLRESYLEMAIENDASVAPVGMAWKKVREDFPSIDLYTSDASHPNINGSYLAACVFYSSMFHKTSVGNTYWSSLDSLTAYRLQDIASRTVLDSLDVWRIDTAAAVPNISDSTITACDSTLVNGTWYYNDTMFSDTIFGGTCNSEVIHYNVVVGNNVEIENFEQVLPLKTDQLGVMFGFNVTTFDSLNLYKDDSLVFTYFSILDEYIYPCNNESDEYTFTLVAYNGGCIDSVTNHFFYCSPLYKSISKLKIDNWTISPNPTNNFININSIENIEFSSSLIDISGREVIQRTSDSRIDLSSLERGIYFVVLYDKNGNTIGQKKLVKN